MKAALKNTKTLHAVLTAAVFATILPSSAIAAQTTYRLTDLGAFSQSGSSFATDINNHGQIVGYGYGADWISHAYIWNNGQLSLLPSQSWRPSSYAAAINDLGVVVGRNSGGSYINAVRWDGDKITTLLSYENYPADSRANDINNSGIAAGYTNSGYLPTIWIDEYRQVLPNFSFAGSAYGVNNLGQVVGQSVPFDSYVTHAVLWSGGRIFDLGVPEGFTDSYAYKINDKSEVVGQSKHNFEGTVHATLWRNGQIIDLGSLNGGLEGSIANDINNLGQIVGTSFVDPADTFSWSTALIWSDSLTPIALETLIDPLDPLSGQVSLSAALAINDLGQIVGNGLINGQRRAFLLTPIAAVPEPSAYAMLGIGLGLLGAAARRRKSA